MNTFTLWRQFSHQTIHPFRVYESMVLPSGSDGKEFACNVGDLGSIPGSGKCPGEGNGCPLQYSCLENAMDRRVWRAIAHRTAESDTTE